MCENMKRVPEAKTIRAAVGQSENAGKATYGYTVNCSVVEPVTESVIAGRVNELERAIYGVRDSFRILEEKSRPTLRAFFEPPSSPTPPIISENSQLAERLSELRRLVDGIFREITSVTDRLEL